MWERGGDRRHGIAYSLCNGIIVTRGDRRVFESHGNGNSYKWQWGTRRILTTRVMWALCFKGVVVTIVDSWATSPGEGCKEADHQGYHVPSHVLTAWIMTALGPALRVPGTFLSTHLCCQTLMGLLFLSALLAKPYSHRDNEGLICLWQYGAFLNNLHVFSKTQTLSNELTNSGAGSCYWYMEIQTLYLYSSVVSSSTSLKHGKVSLSPGLGRHPSKRELGLLRMTGCI